VSIAIHVFFGGAAWWRKRFDHTRDASLNAAQKYGIFFIIAGSIFLVKTIKILNKPQKGNKFLILSILSRYSKFNFDKHLYSK